MIRALLISLLVLQSAAGADGADNAVSFSRQIAPILQAKCLSCHSADKAKGGYRVHTFASLFKPGTSQETPLRAGDPSASELFERLVSSDPDERMPQKDEPLNPAQIELFSSWIAAGATLDLGDTNTPITALVPKAPYPAPPEKYRRPLPLLTLAFTPDGQQLAVGGFHEVTFWSLQGELMRRLTNVPQRVRSLVFHETSNLMAVAGGQPGRSGELRLYSLESGQCETNLLSVGDEILCVASSPDGRWLACGGTDNTIHIFDWAKRERLHAIQQHADWVTAVTFSTNSVQIASASRDRTARVYDLLTGHLDATYTGQTAPLGVVSFLPNGHVLSGGRDKVLHIWDPKDSKKKGDLSGLGSEAYAMLTTAEHAVIACADGAVRQFTLADRKQVRSFDGQTSSAFALSFDPKTQKLASGNYDGSVNVWNLTDGTLVHRFIAAPGWSSIH